MVTITTEPPGHRSYRLESVLNILINLSPAANQYKKIKSDQKIQKPQLSNSFFSYFLIIILTY
jgi:hypothetical protein